MTRTVAEELQPVVEAFAGREPPVAVRFWDGSSVGPDRPPATLVIRSPEALRNILWAPGELGAARAWVVGDLDVEGDIFAALAVRDALAGPDQPVSIHLGPRQWAQLARSARRLGVLGRRPRRPAEEARLKGGRHSRARDAAAIAHHYDVSNDFYKLVLGPTMTYSCAYFEDPGAGLDLAQEAKCDLVCRKLALRPGIRLLDVGCGWGSLVMHAAEHYGARAVGVTISARQAELAMTRVERAGLSSDVEIRLQDYRDIDDGPYDAIASVGMFEHVGLSRISDYVTRLASLLQPEGRLLNHAISRPGGGPPRIDPKSFVARYVFPDGEIHEVGTVVSAIQSGHLEVRDVESLREHYGLTLRAWVSNLEAGWDEAVRLAGARRARIWRLYMAGSALNFEANRTSVHQVLAVKADRAGRSGMPATRSDLLAPAVPA